MKGKEMQDMEGTICAQGGGMWVSSSQYVGFFGASPRKVLNFLSRNGVFWHIMGRCCKVHVSERCLKPVLCPQQQSV